MKITSIILLGGFAVASLLLAEPSPAPRALASGESVWRKDGQVMLVRGGKATPLEEAVTATGDLKMMTNGFFTVKGGKEGDIKEGQHLRVIRTLSSQDAS